MISPDETKTGYNRQQQLQLDQAVAWFKKSSTDLVEEIALAIGNSKDIPIHWLPQFLRKAVAKDMLTDLITRLETNTFDNQAARQKMLEALKKGASPKSIEASLNLMVTTIRRASLRELAGQPAVLEIILLKTDYIAALMKSCLSAAVIEHEKSRMARK